MAKEKTWAQAIEIVLKSSKVPMHYTVILEEIERRNPQNDLRCDAAGTPSRPPSRWRGRSTGIGASSSQLGSGMYTLREWVEAASDAAPVTAGNVEVDPGQDQGGLIKALGMFWRRSLIDWSAKCKLLGRQTAKSDDVDFASQRGIYLLHDGRQTVFVGRSVDRDIGRAATRAHAGPPQRADGIASVGLASTALPTVASWSRSKCSRSTSSCS